jgi:hypothetical protein
LKEFNGFKIFSTSSCVDPYNGKIIERTINKAFPNNEESSLYVVKVCGVKNNLELYENEMFQN